MVYMEQGEGSEADSTPDLPSEPTSAGMHLVGIGASAGGLEALGALLGGLRPGGNVAYVVAQHLSPDHPSLIVDLLGRTTPLQVLTAIDGAELQPDTINVGPPNHDILVRGNRLVVLDPEPRFGPSPNVDRLFDSIAEHWGERGVAVVLSGTGSDGARGLPSVRAAGGLTFAQSPESARFDGMPSAAIALGGADLVLAPAAIAERLTELTQSGGDWVVRDVPEPEPQNVYSLLGQLKHHTGIDFSEYKPATLRRQLQRRMAIRQVESIEEYGQLLASDTSETYALTQNLLVSVTSFFRDPDAYAALGDLLRTYMTERLTSERLRVWVPGCSTGKEAYSIGMLISEVLGHPQNLSDHLKIFATDLDEESLAVARRASYPAAAAAEIPEAVRDRFVVLHNGDMEIRESLRNCVVFARHNVGEDPPFPRLDLISCRNTLIYFTPPMQERVLSLFRFALLPGGLLFLGQSESLGSRTPGFKVADPEHRIVFRTSELAPPRRRTFSSSVPHSELPIPPAPRVSLLRETVPEQHIATLEALVRSRCSPCVILDENLELVEVIGEVSPYCRLPEGRISSAATSFLLPELQAEARALLLLVRADGLPIRSQPLDLKASAIKLRLEASPLPVGGKLLTVLTFLAERTEPAAATSIAETPTRNADFDREIARLESELINSQDSLRRSLADLEGANEELEASSEELQASSEELQSSNEELESSNEELQATNEELATLNQELRGRSEQLQALSSDLENIQGSLNQGMVIVDQDLRVTRYTPLAVRVFALLDSDIGMPLLGIPTTVPLPGLRLALGDVLSGAQRRNIEAASEDIAYLVQVLPYQEQKGTRRGAIITLTDVSEMVALRRAAEASLDEFSTLTDALDEAVWKRDYTMKRLLYASQRFQPLTGWSPAELVTRPELLDEAIASEDRERVWASRNLRQRGWSVEYGIVTREGQRRLVLETAKVISEHEDRYVVGTLSDVTRQRQAEEHSHDLALLFETLTSSPSFALAVLDADSHVVRVNETLCRLLAFDRASLVGSPSSLFCDLPPLLERLPVQEPDQPPPPLQATLALRHRDGRVLEQAAEIWQLPSSKAMGFLLLIMQLPKPVAAEDDRPDAQS
ncbi:MAG: chemotaxis protein CheB [Cyanobium sp. CZS 25K]|nr:chemotaxis protein CheB [Cyanobium sp. CZS25K]